jgi:ketosteroid isomerase-like protein
VTRHARGRASGVDVAQRFALVWTIREGKVIRVVWFLDESEALKSAERTQ